MLPNFNECWWDSWVLDVAICNFAGAFQFVSMSHVVQWCDSTWMRDPLHSIACALMPPTAATIGIALGMWTVKYFECKYQQYNWQGISELRTLRAKVSLSVNVLVDVVLIPGSCWRHTC